MPEKFGYVISRLLLIDPAKEMISSSSALDAIKLGGLKGQGVGEGFLKITFLKPYDYIIAIISEEYGSLFLCLLFFFFIYII